MNSWNNIFPNLCSFCVTWFSTPLSFLLWMQQNQFNNGFVHTKLKGPFALWWIKKSLNRYITFPILDRKFKKYKTKSNMNIAHNTSIRFLHFYETVSSYICCRYAMNCRLRRQQHKETLEIQVKCTLIYHCNFIQVCNNM